MGNFLDGFFGKTRLKVDTTVQPVRTYLKLGTGLTLTDDPTNDQGILTSEGGGGSGTGAIVVASIAAMKALTTVGATPQLANGATINVTGDPSPWVYDSTSGAGFTGDDATFSKPNDVSTPSNGRIYRATSAPVLPTIAALRLAVSGAHASIDVQAFATKGDGGGDPFDYDPADTTTSDNGGTIIVAGTRRYKRRFTGDVHGAWFGLKHDGSNEVTAFNAARAAALAAGVGLGLRVGTLGVVGASLTAGASNEFIYAEVRGKTTIKNLTTPTNVLATKIFVVNNCTGWMLSGVNLDCVPGNAATLDTCGVEFTGTNDNCHLTDVNAQHFSSAVRVWDTCTGSSWVGGAITHPRGCIDANYYGGHLHHNVQIDLAGPAAPTREDHIRGFLIDDVQLTQTTGEASEGRGIILGTSCVGNVFSNLIFDGWRHNCVEFSNSAPITGFFVNRGNKVVDSSFLNCNATTSRALWCFNGIQDALFDACTFYNIPGDAVEFLDSEGCTVSNSKFIKCGAYHDDTDSPASDAGYDYNKSNAHIKQGGVRISYSVPFYRRGNKVVNCSFDQMAAYAIVFAGYATFSSVENCEITNVGLPDVVDALAVRRAISIEWNDGTANINRVKLRENRMFNIGREAIVLTGLAPDSEISENKIGNCGNALAPYQLIVGATNASPIVIKTQTAHLLETGDHVDIANVLGNTAANGNFAVTVLDANRLSLDGSTGNGAYTSGGTMSQTFTISAATNATPIDITTTTDHGYAVNSLVVILGVLGNTAANGYYRVSSVPTARRFTLSTDSGTPIAGNGAYTSGGKVCKAADAIVVGQATSTAGTILAAAPDRLELIHNRVVDDSALGSTTRYAIRYVGTIADSVAKQNIGYGTRWGATFGNAFAFGSNTVYQEGNVDYNSGPKLQPVFTGGQVWTVSAAGKASWGAVDLADNDATANMLAGSKVAAAFGSQQITGGYITLAAGTPSTIANALMVGSASAPLQALDVTGSIRISGSFQRPDNAGAGMTLGNGTFQLNADTSTIKSGNAATTFISWSSAALVTNIPIQPADGQRFSWRNANKQTTVGAAGGASALPGAPTMYLIVDQNGVDYVVPAYAKT